MPLGEKPSSTLCAIKCHHSSLLLRIVPKPLSVVIRDVQKLHALPFSLFRFLSQQFGERQREREQYSVECAMFVDGSQYEFRECCIIYMCRCDWISYVLCANGCGFCLVSSLLHLFFFFPMYCIASLLLQKCLLFLYNFVRFVYGQALSISTYFEIDWIFLVKYRCNMLLIRSWEDRIYMVYKAMRLRRCTMQWNTNRVGEQNTKKKRLYWTWNNKNSISYTYIFIYTYDLQPRTILRW